MWMEFTPKDWLMMRVGLIFREGDPDPEDPWVRSYLDQQQLVPRHQAKEARDGIPCEVLYFGQCYLGRHLHSLQALYQKGLERSLLIEKLRELRRNQSLSSTSGLVELDDHAFETALPSLAEALHEQVAFGADSEGYLTVTLEPTLVAGELTRLVAINSPTVSA
ncbi:MAG TPA: hypothetical protein VLK82_03935 [Candidatus Tectomicrobia bacterium]|nr:hypothetical protein [Candidatus Tectomicrobia bacterium]